MQSHSPFDRIVLIVLDSLGVGAMPDAAAFGDEDSDTLGHICEHRPLEIPHLQLLGIGNIRPLAHIPSVERPQGAYGRLALASNGKDTTTGHWEMAGIRIERAFPTYPNGFPREIIEAFEKAIGRQTLGNVAASGTEIINRLGAEHLRTGFPIVYTSADSVFQVAAHEEVVSVADLCRYCQAARDLLTGEHQVGRVIARPFSGQEGHFVRTSHRQDFAIDPPYPMLLDRLAEARLEVLAVGKIDSIFCHRGISRSFKTSSNFEGLRQTMALLNTDFRGVIFTNLIDFDMHFGHRNDIEGYALALEQFDRCLPDLMSYLRRRDLCVLTADHGCDPATPSTDHSREYVPVLGFGPKVPWGVYLGSRKSLSDIGQTVAENFGTTVPFGESFLSQLI